VRQKRLSCMKNDDDEANRQIILGALRAIYLDALDDKGHDGCPCQE
jgi:hypothetical protein